MPRVGPAAPIAYQTGHDQRCTSVDDVPVVAHLTMGLRGVFFQYFSRPVKNCQ